MKFKILFPIIFIFKFENSLTLYLVGAFDQLKQNATKARIPFYGRWVFVFYFDTQVLHLVSLFYVI